MANGRPTPSPVTAAALWAFLGAMPWQVALDAIVRMDGTHRPALLDLLSEDLVDALLETALLSRDPQLIRQVVDRYSAVGKPEVAARVRDVADQRLAVMAAS